LASSAYSRFVWAAPTNWILVGAASSLAFMLVIKGWANASLLFISLLCLWQIISTPERYVVGRNFKVWVACCVFTLPLFSEISVQLLRGEMEVSLFDGPARLLLAIPIFLYFGRNGCDRVVTALGLGAALGIFFVLLSLILFDSQYWGSRAATYFVDPITLPCYTVALCGVFLVVGIPYANRPINLLLKALAIISTTYIALESESRSSWVALSMLLFFYSWITQTSFLRKFFVSFLVVFCFLATLYSLSDTFRTRGSLAISSLLTYASENKKLEPNHTSADYDVVRDTSTGHRLMLLQLDWYLLNRNPILGVGDSEMPSFEELVSVYPRLTKEILYIKAHAGSHSEFTNHLVTKGLIFGSIVLWTLFIYPAWLARSYFRALDTQSRSNALGLLGFGLPIFFSATTIQVLNLKMTMSIYGLILSVFLANLIFHLEGNKDAQETSEHVG